MRSDTDRRDGFNRPPATRRTDILTLLLASACTGAPDDDTVDSEVDTEVPCQTLQVPFLGQVLSFDGQPLEGVTAFPVGHRCAAVYTDADGLFELLLPEGDIARVRIEGDDLVPVETAIRVEEAQQTEAYRLNTGSPQAMSTMYEEVFSVTRDPSRGTVLVDPVDPGFVCLAGSSVELSCSADGPYDLSNEGVWGPTDTFHGLSDMMFLNAEVGAFTVTTVDPSGALCERVDGTEVRAGETLMTSSYCPTLAR